MTKFIPDCPTCAAHEAAIAGAQLRRNPVAVALHISLQEAHFRKTHDWHVLIFKQGPSWVVRDDDAEGLIVLEGGAK